MDKKCSLYESRPSVCKKYSCANDARIWTDFERMILNDKWLEENLGKEKLSLMNVYI
jgi:Fe-S-cluster containining protein